MRQRPSWDETWMGIARAIATRGDCERAQVGAVLVTPTNRVIATAYNGPPAGSPTGACAACPRRLLGPGEDGRRICLAVHAESNAIIFADRTVTAGATLYVTGLTCWDCAKMIINAGITRLVQLDDDAVHRDPEVVRTLLEQHDVRVETRAWTD